MVTIDRNNAHHSERDGKFATKPRRTGNVALLSADVDTVSGDGNENTGAWSTVSIAPSAVVADSADVGGHSQVGVRSVLRHQVKLYDTSLGDYTEIREGAELGFSNIIDEEEGFDPERDFQVIMGDRCIVGQHAIVHDTVLGDFSDVGHMAQMEDVVAGNRFRTGPDVSVEHVRAGDDVRIGGEAYVRNVTIPERGLIAGNARINDPQHLMTITPYDSRTSQPAVLVHPVLPAWQRGERKVYVTISGRGVQTAVDLNDDEAIQGCIDRCVAADTTIGLFDSQHGREGIFSTLTDPERLAALRAATEHLKQ